MESCFPNTNAAKCQHGLIIGLWSQTYDLLQLPHRLLI